MARLLYLGEVLDVEQTLIGGIMVDQGTGIVTIPLLNAPSPVDENVAEGAASSVSDGGTIPHGLSHTPTVYFVQATVTGEYARVSAVDGTNLTVAIKKIADDTAGTTQTIMYRAVYIAP